MHFFERSIIELTSIGKKREFLFKSLGLNTIKDVLLYFPIKYISNSNILACESLLIKIKVISKIKVHSKFFLVKAIFNDKHVYLNCFNQKFFNIFQIEKIYYIYGEFYLKDENYHVNSPKIINVRKDALVALYKGLPNYLFSKVVNNLIEHIPYDKPIYKGISLKQALFNIHSGKLLNESLEALKYLEASFIKQEFIEVQIYSKLQIDFDKVLEFIPYSLSYDQFKICWKIKEKIASNALKYLVYGEVGAGKTLISLVAALMMLLNGFNVVLLAPTIALANQHYENLSSVIKNYEGLNCILLTNRDKKNKKLVCENNLKGTLIIGTHALLYLEKIENLGLVIIDEMHKFGVTQRNKLVRNATRKNVLMLSATPIPRSLDMAFSKILDYDTLPSFNSKNIETIWIKKDDLNVLIPKLKDKKAFWVVPYIEEKDDCIGVLKRYEFLKQHLEHVILLHGKMKDHEKISSIKNFKESGSAVLISTSVIETGIDIATANLIVIENVEVFGLSQLHQLRGRIGRQGQKSYCVLLSKLHSKKISYMKNLDNGFDISSQDLKLRGGGKMVGEEQSGFLNPFYFLTNEDSLILEKAWNDNSSFEEFSLFTLTSNI